MQCRPRSGEWPHNLILALTNEIFRIHNCVVKANGTGYGNMAGQIPKLMQRDEHTTHTLQWKVHVGAAFSSGQQMF